MRITMIAFGSHGDVQPYVALGLGLQAAGHDVRLASHANFETFICSRGLDFFPVMSNPRDVLETEAGLDWLDTGGNSILQIYRFFYRSFRIVKPLIRQAMIDSLNACQGAEAIVCSHLGFCTAYPVAEKLGVPLCIACLQPWSLTSAFASPYFPAAPDWLPLGSSQYNRATYVLSAQIYWQLLRPSMNEARRDILNLPPLSYQWLLRQMRQQRILCLYGYSPTILPQPPDWGDWTQVTGYWFLDHPLDWQPPTDLVDFLASGSPPVYVGFGSMNNRNPEEVTEMVLKALARCKQRGILLTGWGGISNADLPDEVFKIDAVPHDWLFPRMAAIVHHGGAGTTAAQLRAGVPCVVVPFFADQPFWGQRVFELGVGAKPIPRKWLSEERLAAAIRVATSDEATHARAKALGECIRAEDGVAQAIKIFRRYMRAMVKT